MNSLKLGKLLQVAFGLKTALVVALAVSSCSSKTPTANTDSAMENIDSLQNDSFDDAPQSAMNPTKPSSSFDGSSFGEPMVSYTIVKGDSLSLIAGRLWGNIHAWPALANANPQIKNPDLIYTGASLLIPTKLDDSDDLNSLIGQIEQSGTAENVDKVEQDEPTEADPTLAGTTKTTSEPSFLKEPLKSSTLIIVAGIIMLLLALVIFFWKRAKDQEQHAIHTAQGPSTTLSKLTGFFKSKTGT